VELTDEMLRQIMPNAPKAKRAASLPILNQVMRAYSINNERRAAAWLATLAAESGELKYQQELADGSAYEGRRDLGNTQPGDGKRFKGHGRIQITGRANHATYTHYLKGSAHLPFVDFVKEPQRLAEEPYATDSAGWFWAVLHDLNSLADRRQFLKTQTTVNGRNKRTGLPNHWTERKAYYDRALRVLPDDWHLDGAAPVEDVDHSDTDIAEPVVEDEFAEAAVETNDAAKGVTTSDRPASETSGTPPPAPAMEVKASQPSLFTKLGSLSIPAGVLTVLGGIAKFIQSLPPWAWVAMLGMALLVGYLIWRDSQERANQRTLKVMDAAADKDKNNLRLI